MSTDRASDLDFSLLALTDVGSITCSADSVITAGVGYVGPAFRELHGLITAATKRLDPEPDGHSPAARAAPTGLP